MGISGSNGGTVPYKIDKIYKAIFCGDMALHRPHTGIIYGSYLRFRFLKAIDEFPSFRATDFGASKWKL
jgi:hypothetical protein